MKSIRTLVLLLAGLSALPTWAAQPGGDGPAKPQVGGLLDGGEHRRSTELTLLLGSEWIAQPEFRPRFGPLLRAEFPVVHDGLIPRVNDALGIAIGLDATLLVAGVKGGYVGVRPGLSLEAVWRFHLLKQLSVHGRFGAGLGSIQLPGTCDESGACRARNELSFQPRLTYGGGVAYAVTDRISIQAELFNPGVRVGVGFSL